MRWLVCAAAVLALLSGCYQPQNSVSPARSEGVESSGVRSSSTQGAKVPDPLAGGPGNREEPSVRSEAPSSQSSSSAASGSGPSVPPSASSGESSGGESVSQSSKEVEAPVSQAPEVEEQNLWQLVQVAFEKPVYGAESTRLYFELINNSAEPVYIMRTYQVERKGEDSWIPLAGE